MIENKVWSNDPNQYVIGADEVGRGSFAGPIVAAAVKIKKSHEYLLKDVKDSKKEILDVVKENVNKGENSMFSSKGNDAVRRANYYLKEQILNFEEFNEDGTKRKNPPSDAEWRKFMKDMGMVEISFKKDLNGIKRFAICRKK